MLKLDIGKNGIRRIPLQRIWDHGTRKVSFSALSNLAIEYGNLGEQEDDVHLTITYLDMDGDIITISSDEELSEAILQFIHETSIVVRFFAKFAIQDKEDDSSKKNPARRVPPRKGLKQRVSLLEAKMNLLMKNHQNVAASVHIDVQKGEEIPKAEPKVEVKATPEKASEEKINARSTMTMPTKSEIPPVKDTQKELCLDSFDPNFIHGRHTCDGCYSTPIYGYRFNAINLPDYDLCQKCHKKYKGKDVLFQPEQLQRDEHLQRRWKARKMRQEAAANRRAQTVPVRPPSKNAEVPHKKVANEFTSAAVNEAIRRSLAHAKKRKEDSASSNHIQKATQTTAVDENLPAAIPAPKINEVVKKIEAKDSLKDEAEIEVKATPIPPIPVSVPTPQVIDIIEPLGSLELTINKPQLEESAPPVVIDRKGSSTPSLVSENETPAPSLISEGNASERGESIIDGEEEDAKSESSGGSSNWQVVDDVGEVNDEMVAQAAQLLGSALFQSDIANDLHISSDSVHSGLTSVPSITTNKSHISPVLLKRWEDELFQLHELGFLDDKANVEAFGHLEAANMGVDSDDAITVAAVVDHLLKKKEYHA